MFGCAPENCMHVFLHGESLYPHALFAVIVQKNRIVLLFGTRYSSYAPIDTAHPLTYRSNSAGTRKSTSFPEAIWP
jgi:hypothetical protein